MFVRKSFPAPASVAGSVSLEERTLTIALDILSAAARRLLNDYARDAGGDIPGAVARGLHEAAIARRGRLIDPIVAEAPHTGLDSMDIIRKDRDHCEE